MPTQTAPLLKPLEVLRRFRAHNNTLSDALASRLAADPDQVFCVFDDRSMSWRDLHASVTRLAAAFAAQGVGAGARVGIMARNQDTHVLFLLALAHLSAVMVPINPDFGVSEARYVLQHADLSGLAYDEHALHTVQQAYADAATRPWMIDLSRQTSGQTSTTPRLSEFLAHAAHAPEVLSQAHPDDTCVIIYTSGTTGFPKGVMHSQRSFLLGGEAFVERVYLQPSDRLMIVLPFFHMNALFYSVAGAIAAGASVVIVPRFSASAFWEQARSSQATVVNLIEAACNILKARPRTEFRADHQLRCAYGVRHSAQQAFRDEFHVPYFVSGFGMTEIPGVTCSPFEGPHKTGTMGPVGRHPDPTRPWAECRVVDEQGQTVPDNTVGELIVRTPTLMQGYFRDPEQTASAFRDGWFLTGDLVRCDKDGYYTFVSRKKDIIRRRGENIAGAELDRVIGEHPGVAEVAAIAVPAELGEDDILVAVVAKADQALSAHDIGQWCAQRLSAIKVPRYVVFLDRLPHTPTHKIAKAILRADTQLLSRAIDLTKT